MGTTLFKFQLVWRTPLKCKKMYLHNKVSSSKCDTITISSENKMKKKLKRNHLAFSIVVCLSNHVVSL